MKRAQTQTHSRRETLDRCIENVSDACHFEETIAINQCILLVNLINFAQNCFGFIRSAMVTITLASRCASLRQVEFLRMFFQYA